MRNPPAKMIRVLNVDWQDFESRMNKKVSMLEALFGLMVTSEAEITDGGEKRTNPLVYQVGELGAQLLDDLCHVLFDSFEVAEAETSPPEEVSPAPEPRTVAPTCAIDAPTICDVFIADEALAHLSDSERQALLGRIWERFAAQGWEMASYGPLAMAARLRKVETIRRLDELMNGGGKTVDELVRRIQAAWEWRQWTDRHGGIFSAPRPWPVGEISLKQLMDSEKSPSPSVSDHANHQEQEVAHG